MKHLMGKGSGVSETLDEEREALSADIKHLQEQSARYGANDGDDSFEAGGVLGLLLREKRRMFDILHSM